METISNSHPHCFLAGTNIITQNGEKPIESINKGDFVLTHKMRFRKVTMTHKHIIEGSLVLVEFFHEYGKPLLSTSNPPIFTCDIENEYTVVEAINLNIGERIYRVVPYGAGYIIFRVKIIERRIIYCKHYNEPLHNLSVDEDESFIADGIAVHNCC